MSSTAWVGIARAAAVVIALLGLAFLRYGVALTIEDLERGGCMGPALVGPFLVGCASLYVLSSALVLFRRAWGRWLLEGITAFTWIVGCLFTAVAAFQPQGGLMGKLAAIAATNGAAWWILRRDPVVEWCDRGKKP